MNLEERINKRIDKCEEILKEDVDFIKNIVNNKIITESMIDIKDNDYLELKQKIEELGTVLYTRFILTEKIINKKD